MKIAAFNVKNLEISKASDDVRRNLIKIVSQYSVVVMIEVVGSTYKDINKFLEELNQCKKNKLNSYLMQISKPLGRGEHKERFLYFYRMNEMSVLDTYQYKEGEEDTLARKPFVLWLECPNAVVQNLVLIPVHAKPEEAETELEAQHDVVEAVRRRWKTDNIMILGDFNAGGRYLSRKTRENVHIWSNPHIRLTTCYNNDNTYGKHDVVESVRGRLKTDNIMRLGDFNAGGRYLSRRRRRSVCIRSPLYIPLIDDYDDYHDHYDYVNTTTSNNSYDRIVVYGDEMYKAVVPGSAKAFNFQRAYRLSDDITKAISDHYPVEVELK